MTVLVSIFLFPCICGLAALPALWPEYDGGLLLLLCCAWGGGSAILALAYGLWTFVAPGYMPAYPWLEAAAIAVMSPAALRAVRGRRWFANDERCRALPLALVSAALIGLAVSCAIRSAAGPRSGFDAWGFWNLRAKIIFANPRNWVSELSAIDWRPNHNNFLLLPFMVARGWQFAGADIAGVPIAVSLAFAAAWLAGLFALLEACCGAGVALFGLAAMLGFGDFSSYATQQMADLPLGYYAMMALGLAAVAVLGNARKCGIFVAAGLFAGCAAFMKVEGMVFFGVLGAALWAVAWQDDKRHSVRVVAAFCAAAMPLMLAALLSRGSSKACTYMTPYTAAQMFARAQGLLRGYFCGQYGLRMLGLIETAAFALLSFPVAVARGSSGRKAVYMCMGVFVVMNAALLFGGIQSDLLVEDFISMGLDRMLLQMYGILVFSALLSYGLGRKPVRQLINAKSC